jgi:hypothetical protein
MRRAPEQRVAQDAEWAAQALVGMPPRVVARLPDNVLHALAHAAAQDSWNATSALCAMPPHTVDRLPDARLHDLAQTAAQAPVGASDALWTMESYAVLRLPDDALSTPTQAASRLAGWTAILLTRRRRRCSLRTLTSAQARVGRSRRSSRVRQFF